MTRFTKSIITSCSLITINLSFSLCGRSNLSLSETIHDDDIFMF